MTDIYILIYIYSHIYIYDRPVYRVFYVYIQIDAHACIIALLPLSPGPHGGGDFGAGHAGFALDSLCARHGAMSFAHIFFLPALLSFPLSLPLFLFLSFIFLGP